MKEMFSFERFKLLVGREMMVNKRIGLLKIVSGGLAVCLFAVIITIGNYTNGGFYAMTGEPRVIDSEIVGTTLSTFYFSILFIVSIVMVSSTNKQLSAKGELANWLLLPATNLEKYLLKLFYAFVMVPLVLVCWITISELGRVIFYNIFFSEYTTTFLSPVKFFQIVADGGGIFYKYTLYMLLVSFFFFGSFLFRTNVFFKTFLVGIIYGILNVVIMSVLVFNMVSDKVGTYYSSEVLYISRGSDTLLFDLINVSYVFSWILILFFMVWPYFKMKDTELIDRY